MSELTREQFGQLIGQVRANGACPDAPLLAVYDALRTTLADRDSEIERLTAEMGYHEAKDVIEQLTQHLADRDATIARLQTELIAYKHTAKSQDALDDELDAKDARIAQLEEALTFYMDETHWVGDVAGGGSDAVLDRGWTAQQALADEEQP